MFPCCITSNAKTLTAATNTACAIGSPRASAADGGEGAIKDEAILTVDYWPDPWTLEKTDPALRMQQVFPLTDEGRAAAAQCLQDAFNAEPDRWKHCPDMMDCDPWEPPAEEQAEE